VRREADDDSLDLDLDYLDFLRLTLVSFLPSSAAHARERERVTRAAASANDE
jgi:hypothetical protein